jgi:hypothetical protein
MQLLEGRMALGIRDLLVHSFLYGLLKSLILEFDFWVALRFIAAMTVLFSVPASQLVEKLSFRIKASL